MSEFRADLHSHTTCSDGSMTPDEVIHLAKKIGLSGLSITDHDSIAAYPKALELARLLEIRMIPGVEFSTMHHDVSIHLLGYSFQIDHPAILDLCQRHQLRREMRNQQILEKLEKLGFPLTMEEIAKNEKQGSIGRPHIALAMMRRGYVQTIEEAFRVYLGEGKLAYNPGNPFSVEETIDVVHKAKGLAIIAHPHLIQDDKTLRDLLNMPFDGMECFYAKFPPENHKRWLKIAQKQNWLITGGSDFHGSVKASIPLGCSWVDENHFNILDTHYRSHTPS